MQKLHRSSDALFNQAMYRLKNQKHCHSFLLLPWAKESAPFFGEARFRLVAINVSVKERALRLRYLSITLRLTNHSFPASLSSKTNPELQTEILPSLKNGYRFFC